MSQRFPRRVRAGFTLVELLVVMAVIGMIVALAIPSIEPMMKGSKLTTAADDLRFRLSGYRQRAVTENQPVEIRFLKFIDTSVPGGREAYRGYVAGRFRPARESGGNTGALRFIFEPIDNVVRLPEGVVLSSIPEMATMLHHNDVRRGTHPYPIEGQENVEFAGFSFRPDGSTDLPKRAGDIWFVTLMHERDDIGNNASPDNFITLAVDSFNGAVRTYTR